MGNEESTKFWLDHWHTRGIFKDIFPRLYALESSKDVTVSSKIGDTSLVCSFRRIPIGGIEQNQFDSLVELVRSVTIVPKMELESGEYGCGLVRDIANKVLSWWNLDHANLNSYAEWKSWLVSIRMDSKLKKMFEGVWYSIWCIDLKPRSDGTNGSKTPILLFCNLAPC
ncbi:hypothetical protein Tco_1213190 [Tanacetum coccineum]